MSRRESPFGSDPSAAFRAMRTRIPAPVGCFLLFVLLPLVLIGGLLFVVMSLLRGLFAPRRVVHRGPAGGHASGPAPGTATGRSGEATPRGMPRYAGDTGREIALCSLVRNLALDEQFTRDDALSMAVIAPPGSATPSTEQLLADAIERGWITGDPDALRVTPTGRHTADEFLDRAGV